MSDPTEGPDAATQINGLIFALIVIDAGGRIAQVNPAAEDLLGRSASRMVGQNAIELLGLSDPRVTEGVQRADAPLVARDILMAGPAGERRVNLTSSPLHSHPGWHALTLSDAGPGHEADEDVRPELRAPGVLAHEIKNPLAAIRGASQLLARRLDQRNRPLAKIIATEVDRIAGLIDRMQQLGSSAVVEPQACNLHACIRNAMATVRVGCGNAVELVEEFDPSLPPVSADPAALEQVLINLIANACDAVNGCAAPRVEVKTRFVSGLVFNVIRFGKATRLPVEVVVTDAGPGVDPALRDHIFEPFVSSKSKGQGLGLALVRKLVRDMGGRIAHERDERAGLTHFRINLAIAETSA
ncbi:nitrogen regulation protein NR(II) [Qipengyuania sp.]|uniref:two-component system sensor histidine kinase NtrB n=1 Tax=Qipengyuania sp. TaxID=2004515 RepID=UPI0035C816BC